MAGMGMGAVEQAVERSQKSGGGTGDGKYLSNIYWKDDRDKEGEHYSKVVRFLTDDVITCGFYEFVPGGRDGKGTRDFVAVDTVRDIRTDPTDPESPLVFPELENERDYFITNGIQLPNFQKQLKPAKDRQAQRTVALAVLREEVRKNVDGKTRLVVQDKVVKRTWKDKDDEEHEEEGLVYGTIKQAHKNFWHTLVGYFNRYGTLTDRDYMIERRGNKTDSTYTIVPLDPDPELRGDTLEETQAKLAERYKPPMTLNEWIVSRAKYEAVEEWVKGTSMESAGGSATGETDSGAPAQEETVRVPASDAAKSLKEELQSFRS